MTPDHRGTRLQCDRNRKLAFVNVLRKRLGKFGLVLEPTKTKLVEFGRYAQRYASQHGSHRIPLSQASLGAMFYLSAS